jgi:hypothetical protein
MDGVEAGMTDLERRIARLEAHHQVSSVSAEDAAEYARQQRWLEDLNAFVRAAFPESRDCVAHHVAQIMGLPDSKAYRDLLQRQPRDLEAIARDRFGKTWKADMETTAAAAAVHCQNAHGPEWPEKFLAIWCGGRLSGGGHT